jgi:hypothetical protein
MTFWLQHGYGKADRVTTLVRRRDLDGVVLSPAHESAASLRETANELREAEVPVAVDPQTYLYSIAGASGRGHREHGLDFGPVHWSIDPAAIEEQVQAVARANDAIGSTGPFIAPSVLQRGFGDAWAVSALQYARVSARVAADRDVLASVIVEDRALGNWPEIDEWLDVATTLTVSGFYVLVARDSTSYPVAWDAQRLANLMRLAYRLSELNGYGFLLGYADFDGLPVLAAGASGIASGWHYGLRDFRPDRWIPGGFGRQPIPRVTSRPLLSPLEARGETEQVLRSPLAEEVIPELRIRQFLEGGVARWTNQTAHMHHLTELSGASRSIAERPTVGARLDSVQSAVNGAIELLGRVKTEHIALSPAYGARLASMSGAITEFRRAEGV